MRDIAALHIESDRRFRIGWYIVGMRNDPTAQAARILLALRSAGARIVSVQDARGREDADPGNG